MTTPTSKAAMNKPGNTNVTLDDLKAYFTQHMNRYGYAYDKRTNGLGAFCSPENELTTLDKAFRFKPMADVLDDTPPLLVQYNTRTQNWEVTTRESDLCGQHQDFEQALRQIVTHMINEIDLQAHKLNNKSAYLRSCMQYES